MRNFSLRTEFPVYIIFFDIYIYLSVYLSLVEKPWSLRVGFIFVKSRSYWESRINRWWVWAVGFIGENLRFSLSSCQGNHKTATLTPAYDITVSNAVRGCLEVERKCCLVWYSQPAKQDVRPDGSLTLWPPMQLGYIWSSYFTEWTVITSF